MKAIVIYDSNHGNTEMVAQAIGEAIDAQAVKVNDINKVDLKEYDLLIVGSPTNGGWPTQGIMNLLKSPLALEGVNGAAFDTRTATIWNRLLPFGYAAPRIASMLEKKCKLQAQPEGFIVLGIRGPLKEGELERAAAWARGLAKGLDGSTRDFDLH
ncbi:MAG: flavodoxin domain-containing protein [Anaerolineales bacterium]|nr:flavodoxin domain-containing protein [Anaerolineales bacterium]